MIWLRNNEKFQQANIAAYKFYAYKFYFAINIASIFKQYVDTLCVVWNTMQFVLY